MVLPSWPEIAHYFYNENTLTNLYRLDISGMSSLVEKILRTAIVYGALVLLVRAFGKRELAQLNPFDLVVLLLLSNSVQNAVIGNETTLFGGLFGAATLLIINYFVVRYLFRHRRLDQLLEGSPTTLIEKGQLQEDAMAQELLTTSELLTVAHRQGFANLAEIETCILEPGGTFFIQGKAPSSSETQYKDLCARLDALSNQLAELKYQKG
jgi:uncharacterized membrane protein YcaP (DUF421 family)